MIDLQNGASTVIEATILVVAALFPVVNPLAAAAVLLNVFSGLEPAVHRALARKISIYCFFLLIGSLLWGVKILTFFGISIYAVQIGGGLVVAVTGWSLLARDSNSTRSNNAQDASILIALFILTPCRSRSAPARFRLRLRSARTCLRSCTHRRFFRPGS